MTTFSTYLLKCPYCACLMYNYELTSYTVHNSVVYSDGKVEHSPFITFGERILICDSCDKDFWIDDARIEDDKINNDDLPQAKDIYDLPIALDENFSYKFCEHISTLLDNGFADNSDKETYLRLRLWHLLNDAKRAKKHSSLTALIKGNLGIFTRQLQFNKNNKKLEKEFRNIFASNLNRLASIYPIENDDDRLMLAEMQRELGEFELAKKTLNSIKEMRGTKAYKSINKANNKKRKTVFEI